MSRKRAYTRQRFEIYGQCDRECDTRGSKKIATFDMTVRAPLREASRSILTSPYAEELHLDGEASIWEDWVSRRIQMRVARKPLEVSGFRVAMDMALRQVARSVCIALIG